MSEPISTNPPPADNHDARPEPDPQPLDSLLEDQSKRWQRGERVLVETYLEQRPALQANPKAVFELIYQEIVLREETGEAPPLEEYLRRFPQFASKLRGQFEVDEAFRSAHP